MPDQYKLSCVDPSTIQLALKSWISPRTNESWGSHLNYADSAQILGQNFIDYSTAVSIDKRSQKLLKLLIEFRDMWCKPSPAQDIESVENRLEFLDDYWIDSVPINYKEAEVVFAEYLELKHAKSIAVSRK